jgi:hypothetical protein
MAGVLFVVCIPREKYEKCMSSKQHSSEEEGFGDENANLNDSLSTVSVQVKHPVENLGNQFLIYAYFCRIPA